MGVITLTNVFFEPASSSAQTVRVEYRLASSSGAFTLKTNSAPVLSDGTFNPAVVINGLIDGERYSVKITNLCNGTSVIQDFYLGQSCRSYTFTANVGGAFVNFESCISGVGRSRQLASGASTTFCSRVPPTSHSGTGSIVEGTTCYSEDV